MSMPMPSRKGAITPASQQGTAGYGRLIKCAGRLPARHRTITRAASTASPINTAAVARRGLLFGGLAGISLTLNTDAAQAGELGQTIAKVLWTDRQKENKDIFLAPIWASEQRLQEATNLLLPSDPSNEAFLAALKAVRASSLNCYMYDPSSTGDNSIETRASQATQQAQFGGADTCTLRLIVKNVTGLLPDEQRRDGERIVEAIILSYQKLDGKLEASMNGGSEVRTQAKEQLAVTASLLEKLESYVSGILA